MSYYHSSSFWRVCYGENNTDCHCDWRIVLTDCVERGFVSKVFMLCLTWNIILIFPTLWILYERLIVKKMVVFERVPQTCFIRPKPIEAMVFWILFFVSFLFELTWECGLCSTTCYVFGLAYTASHKSEIINSNMFFSRAKVDMGFFVLTTVPFIFNNTCAILAGIFGLQQDFAKARIFTTLIYSMWILDCIILGSMTVYFGTTILSIFKIYLTNRRGPADASTESIKSSMIRMKAVSFVLTLNYVLYAILKSVYCLGRDEMMVNKTFNIALCTFWNMVATINVTLVLAALIFNPKLLNPLSYTERSINPKPVDMSEFTHGLDTEASTVYCRSIEVLPSKEEEQEQKHFYNMVMENSRIKKEEPHHLYRQSIHHPA
ncbi:hypothetical protein BY458DRAFT_547711 [Sporodiniella umbellata]|nr:hypothetical protein BY458DRAFT_547711 [Sporodiniella umbellata]